MHHIILTQSRPKTSCMPLPAIALFMRNARFMRPGLMPRCCFLGLVLFMSPFRTIAPTGAESGAIFHPKPHPRSFWEYSADVYCATENGSHWNRKANYGLWAAATVHRTYLLRSIACAFFLRIAHWLFSCPEIKSSSKWSSQQCRTCFEGVKLVYNF